MTADSRTVNTRFLVLPKKLKKSPVLGAFPPEKHG